MYKIFCKNFKKVLTNIKQYDIINVSNEREVMIMKKVVNFVQYVSFDGGKTFQDTSIWNHPCYVEPIEDKIVVLETFEQAYEYIKADKLMNAEIGATFFKGRKQIYISTAELDYRRSFTEKNYEPIIIKTAFEEMTNVSMESLFHLLSADEFCEYLKDRNISFAKF